MKKQAKRGNGNGTLQLRGKVWRARWMVNGKLFTRSTGETTRREAEKKLAEFVAPFQLGTEKDALETITAKLGGVSQELKAFEDGKPAMTVAEAWKAYERSTNRPDSGARTLLGYEGQFGQFQSWLAERYPEAVELRQVGKEQADEFARDVAARLSPNSYNKYVTILACIWRTLKEEARLTCNPWEGMKHKVVNPHSRRELTVEELTRICGAVKGEMRTLFAIGIYTGLRLGDAVNLSWGSVDLARGFITLTPRKTARRHPEPVAIPIPATLGKVLTETGAAHKGAVLPELSRLYSMDPARVTLKVQAVFRECGIETTTKEKGMVKAAVDVGFHSLRHTYVSLCANAGVPLAIVQAIVGHSNPAMTQHYFHVSTNALRDAATALPSIGAADAGAEGPGASERKGTALQAILDKLPGLADGELDTLAQKVAEAKAGRVRGDSAATT